MKYAGSDWIKKSLKLEMSSLGEEVADLLGDLYQGIYHIETNTLRKVDWKRDFALSIILPSNGFATFDGCKLTHLVLMCHDRLIRCEIKGKSPWGYMELMFHKRKGREGNMCKRHPSMEDAIKSLRKATND